MHAELRAARFLKAKLVGRGPVNVVVIRTKPSSWLSSNKEMPEFHSDLQYGTWQATQNGNPMTYRGLTQPNDQCRLFLHLIGIFWDHEDFANGLPSPEVNDAQVHLEDTLDQLESESSGILSLVVFGNGRKEWHWYVADIDAWMNGLNECLSDHEPYPIRIEFAPNDNWQFHETFMSHLIGS